MSESSTAKDPIQEVANAAFAFGAESAQHVDAAIFDDPIMHNYFLFYVYGALDWLGTHWQAHCVIDQEDKLEAMTQALLIMEPDQPEKSRSFARMAQNALDDYALDIRNAGGSAIQSWLIDPQGDSTQRFTELLAMPDKFPRTVETDDN